MVGNDLRPMIQKTVREAKRENRSVTTKGLLMREESNLPLDITVFPVKYSTDQDIFTISFFEVAAEKKKKSGKDGEDEKVKELKGELERAREHLSATAEELESANEELKATNEELESANEELQSTNEELETSREELQSLNEELMTVNTEHQQKIERLELSNRDLKKILEGTGIPTIFLDQELNINKFTESLFDLIRIRNIDEGRNISELSHMIGRVDLTKEIKKSMKKKEPGGMDVRSIDGKWFRMNIIPQKQDDKGPGGVILTFVDISRFKGNN
jgi:two-component system CheB/CheR fusion protein